MGDHSSTDRSWLIPLVYSVAAVLLGLLFPRLEWWLFPSLSSPISSNSAIAVFSSVAAGMMSFTAIVFSLVFVIAQFNAVAYSPRLALWLGSDPLMFHGIGIFTATFIYALVALAWIDRANTARVPWLTTINVFLLVVASVVTLARLVERISRLKITNVLALAEEAGRRAADKMYPPITSEAPVYKPHRISELPPIWHTIHYEGELRVVQSLDAVALVQEASQSGAVIEVLAGVGDTVIKGEPLFNIRGAAPYLLEVRLHSTLQFATTRALDLDPRCALRVLVDIAIKALSPAINDPTTAVQALDYIKSLLACIGKRQLPDSHVYDESDTLRLVYPVPTWEDFVSLALDEIRAYGGTSSQVMRRMRALLRDLLSLLPAERQISIREQLARVEDTVLRNFPTVEDLHDAQEEDRQGLGMARVRGTKFAQV